MDLNSNELLQRIIVLRSPVVLQWFRRIWFLTSTLCVVQNWRHSVTLSEGTRGVTRDTGLKILYRTELITEISRDLQLVSRDKNRKITS